VFDLEITHFYTELSHYDHTSASTAKHHESCNTIYIDQIDSFFIPYE